jgi:hypothetical protein
MGWTSLLGDLAKGFAQGYIEERGVKGTVEDVAGFAKSLFSSDENNDAFDEFISKYNELIDAEEYSEANELVNEVYKDEEKDVFYYYLDAQSCNLMAINDEVLDDGIELIQYAVKSIKKAWKLVDKDSDLAEQIKDLKETIFENQNCMKNRKVKHDQTLADWSETLKKVAGLCTDEKDFAQAEKVLLAHYQEYEDGELDYFYWYQLALIHYSKHLVSITEEENESTYRIFLKDIDHASEFIGNDADRAAEISELRQYNKNIIESGAGSNNGQKTEKSSKEQANSNESEYLAELKSCLEDDGVISDRERRLLNKLRQSLGISEKRAEELEMSLSSQRMLTPDEQEYADEFKACLEDDGEISSKERRLLDKLRNSLGITPERAKEIEDNLTES